MVIFTISVIGTAQMQVLIIAHTKLILFNALQEARCYIDFVEWFLNWLSLCFYKLRT